MKLRRFVVITLVAGGFVLLTCLPSLAASQISPQSFDRQLLKAAIELDAAVVRSRHSPHSKLTVPALQLPPAPLGGAPMYSPSLDQWLQSSLARIRNEKKRKLQERELTDLAASLRRAAQPTREIAPQADPKAEAEKILTQRAYQVGGSGAAPPPRESLWDRFLRWLARIFDMLFGGIFRATASKPIIGQIIAVLFLLVLVGAASYGVYLLATSLARRQRPARGDEGAPLASQIDPDGLYQLGLAVAADGRFAQAISLLFQASLASLDRAGKLQYDASRTPGEYRRAVRRTVATASPYFDTIAQAFVLAAFAERQISADDWSTADSAFHSLRPILAS